MNDLGPDDTEGMRWGGAGTLGVVAMFYDSMLVYQGSSIKRSQPEFPIYLSAPCLGTLLILHCSCQEQRTEKHGCTLQQDITYPTVRQAVRQHDPTANQLQHRPIKTNPRRGQ